ncbi:MAG: formate hydrogenlyase [Proteobacteria bacterium]|nr:formate hydrogenlyase [Pseudomonadota bacterium]
MDVGTAFGGMGASREMLVSALAEPAMLMAVFTLAMTAYSTNLASVVDYHLTTTVVPRTSFLFALGGLILVAIAETGRIPVDNPATHLELTRVGGPDQACAVRRADRQRLLPLGHRRQPGAGRNRLRCSNANG